MTRPHSPLPDPGMRNGGDESNEIKVNVKSKGEIKGQNGIKINVKCGNANKNKFENSGNFFPEFDINTSC